MPTLKVGDDMVQFIYFGVHDAQIADKSDLVDIEEAAKGLLMRRGFMAAHYTVKWRRSCEAASKAAVCRCPQWLDGIGVSSQSGAPLSSSCDSTLKFLITF